MKIKEYLIEKDIVNNIVKNWTKFFPELKNPKKEFTLRKSRVDIFTSYDIDLKDYGLREESTKAEAAVFMEVKYNSNMRDLMFEIQKLINFRDFYINYGKAFAVVAVISDEYDYNMVKFFQDNNVLMYKIDMKEEDLKTMTIEEYSLIHKEIEEGNEIRIN